MTIWQHCTATLAISSYDILDYKLLGLRSTNNQYYSLPITYTYTRTVKYGASETQSKMYFTMQIICMSIMKMPSNDKTGMPEVIFSFHTKNDRLKKGLQLALMTIH